MRIKTRAGVAVFACAIIGITLFGFIQKEPYSTEAVMESLWDQHNVQSTGIGGTDPVLDVSVYDEKDIAEVESYLQKNLSKNDLEHYKLIVYEYSESPWEFRENALEKREAVYE